MSGRKVAKRACDGCKIRKIKCTEVAPCAGCIAAGIACTFVKIPSTRGPRRLRRSTLQEIAQTQQQWEDLALASPAEPVIHTNLDVESVFAPSKVAALVLQLCIYRLRCYPVWPVIKVERLVASLQKPQPDIEVFALAYAVAAATIAQIRSKPSEQPSGVTASMMEAQCLYAKAHRNRDLPPDLTTVRIPFFLHIYYENLEPGGIQSITCLRESIAIAHMIGLHRESYYQNVEPEEQEIRRRTMWLLYVTERGVSITHRLPVTIKTKIAFPSTSDTDEKEVLLAYQKLITMFWSFDQAGVFELLDSQDFDLSGLQSHDEAHTQALTAIRSQLDGQILETHKMNDVQAVQISVARQWMRVIVWRLAESHGFFSNGHENSRALLNDPVLISRELLSTLSRFPTSAIEAQGPALETKVFEIACSVADAIALSATGSTHPDLSDQKQARDTLSQLQKLLTKNKKLSTMLASRISKDRQRGSFDQSSNFGPPAAEDMNMMDLEIEQQLQAHGFDFTDPMAFGQSPDTESLNNEHIERSPQKSSTRTQSQSQANFSPVAMLDHFPQPNPGPYNDNDDNHRQEFADMNFSFNNFPSGDSASFGTFQDANWANFSISDHSAVVNELVSQKKT